MTRDREVQRAIVLEGAQRFLDAALARDMWVSPNNRIGTRDAAKLLGLSGGHLRNLISRGEGPVQCGAGGGFRKTVALLDLAEWDESRRLEWNPN